MTAEQLVELILDADLPVKAALLDEAAVRRPRRGRIWIAVFTGPEPGQVWRSTGLEDREQALALARKWEAEARRERAARGGISRKPTIRVRPGGAEKGVGLLTQKEVAAILKLSERAVREIERRAFAKLRRALRSFWREHTSGDVEEGRRRPVAGGFDFTSAEIRAMFARTRNDFERQTLRKVLALIGISPAHRSD
jgi:hypothetical protein